MWPAPWAAAPLWSARLSLIMAYEPHAPIQSLCDLVQVTRYMDGIENVLVRTMSTSNTQTPSLSLTRVAPVLQTGQTATTAAITLHNTRILRCNFGHSQRQSPRAPTTSLINSSVTSINTFHVPVTLVLMACSAIWDIMLQWPESEHRASESTQSDVSLGGNTSSNVSIGWQVQTPYGTAMDNTVHLTVPVSTSR